METLCGQQTRVMVHIFYDFKDYFHTFANTNHQFQSKKIKMLIKYKRYI